MDNYQKIEHLRGMLNAILCPKLKEYVEAELSYSSEIANGYIASDKLKAELQLISAMNNLLKK